MQSRSRAIATIIIMITLEAGAWSKSLARRRSDLYVGMYVVNTVSCYMHMNRRTHHIEYDASPTQAMEWMTNHNEAIDDDSNDVLLYLSSSFIHYLPSYFTRIRLWWQDRLECCPQTSSSLFPSILLSSCSFCAYIQRWSSDSCKNSCRNSVGIIIYLVISNQARRRVSSLSSTTKVTI